MNILIVNNMAPFIHGGAEELAHHLEKNLKIAGYQAEILKIPFAWEPASIIPSQILMAKSFELCQVDRVIALKFPAYLIQHPHKTLWLLHQYRQAYDLFDANQTNLPNDETGHKIREIIVKNDNQAFSECQAIYTNSKTTQERLKKYNQFNAKILLPPLNDPELFTGGTDDHYLLAAGRVNGMKRQSLLLDAFAKAKTNGRLIIAGPPETVEDEHILIKKIKDYQIEDRVTLDLRFLPRKTYAKYVNHATAVAYLPFDEDSIGYVTMEAAAAHKPILTTNDSGGVLNLVQHHLTGWVATPDAEDLAYQIESIFHHKSQTQNYGKAAKEKLISLNINWENTIRTLLK